MSMVCVRILKSDTVKPFVGRLNLVESNPSHIAIDM